MISTRMKVFLAPLLLLLLIAPARAAVPTLGSFEPTQFDTNLNRVKYLAVWTNETTTIHPAQANTEVTVTNLNLYETFVLPSKVRLLTLGTNELDVSTNTTWLLSSPTNDASQVILSLSAGKFQGQLLLITSQNSDGAFTLPDLSEQFDTPGAYVDLQGDWIGTTNRGLILQYSAPDWIEMDRADPSSTNGPFGGALWSESGGTISPDPAANVSTGTGTLSVGSLTNLLFRSGADLIYTNAAYGGLTGFKVANTNGSAYLSATSSGNAQLQAPVGKVAVLAVSGGNDLWWTGSALLPIGTDDLGGGATQWRDFYLSRNIVWNGSTNSLFDSWGTGTPESVVTARPGSIFRDALNGDIYKKASGTGNTGWEELTGGGGSPLWASSSGNLFPSPAVDVVTIESQSADNATNVAMRVVFDNTQTAPGNVRLPYYAVFVNGTLTNAILTSRGGLGLGNASIMEADVQEDIAGIEISHDAATDPLGTTDIEIWMESRDSSSYNAYSTFNVYNSADLSFPYVDMSLSATGTNSAFAGNIKLVAQPDNSYLTISDKAKERVRLLPSADAGQVPFHFETINPLTSGNFWELVNGAGLAAGTNIATVDWSGNGFFAGTVSVGSLTNTLLRSGSDLIYTNASGTSGFQVDSGGGGARLQGGSVAQLKATGAANAAELNDGSTGVRWFGGELFPTTSGKNLGSASSVSWQDVALSRNIVWNGTTNSLFDTWGSGSPEGVVTARPGSLYRDTLNGDIYKKDTGTGNTGWIELAAAGGAGDVTAASTFGADNRIIRSDGTGKGVQASGWTIDDSDHMTIGGTNVLGAIAGKAASGANSDITSLAAITGPIGTPTAITLNSGPITVSAPSIDIAQTWNNSGVGFTALRIIATNSASSLGTTYFLESVLGSTKQFTVRRDGTVQSTGGYFTSSDTMFLSSGQMSLGSGMQLTGESSGIIQQGVDAATPAAQTFKGPDGSGADKTGGSLTITGGKSTGTGVGGALISQTSLTGSTGSALNSQSTRRYEYAGEKTLTESTATTVLNIALASSKYLGGRLTATTHADDATDFQAITDDFTFSAINKAGTVTVTIQATPSTSATAASAGTLTTAWTIVANGATVDIKNNAASSLTQTTLKTKWILELNSDDVGTVTP